MATILIFFLSFFMSYFGFLLKKSTSEEFKELKEIVPKLNEIFLLIIYGLFLSFFNSPYNILFLFICFLIFAIGKVYLKDLIEFHNILFFSVTFILAINSEQFLYFAVLPIIYLLIDNSFKDFKLKEKVYEIIFLFISFLILNFLL